MNQMFELSDKNYIVANIKMLFLKKLKISWNKMENFRKK